LSGTIVTPADFCSHSQAYLLTPQQKVKPPKEKDIKIAGKAIGKQEDRWVRFMATTVVPKLAKKYPDRDERLRVAAETTWWGLREGSLSLAGLECSNAGCGGTNCRKNCAVRPPITNPNLFSNCSRTVPHGRTEEYCGNFHLYCQPLEICDPDLCVNQLNGVCPWQVGIVAAIVPRHGTTANCVSDASCKDKDRDDENLVQGKVSQLFSASQSLTAVLIEAVQLAGLDPTAGVGQTIIGSDAACDQALANDGDTRAAACQLRRSWLVRHPAVSVAVEDDNVQGLCVHLPRSAAVTGGVIDASVPCPGAGCVGPNAGAFSGTQAEACRAQKDLFHVLYELAP
jgi:hypothetical protein